MSTTFAGNETPTGELQAVTDQPAPESASADDDASDQASTDVADSDASATSVMALADDGTMQRVTAVTDAKRVIVPVDATAPEAAPAAKGKPPRRIASEVVTYLAYVLVAIWVT